jgi:hypothetical protein
MVNGYHLRQVLSAAQLAPGSFFADITNQLLYVWDSANGDLNKALVEASVRQESMRVEGEYVQVRGLHFRYAANAAQHGAVWLGGPHDVLEDCVLEEMNSSGATFAAVDLTVRRCAFRNNGQIGFGANRAHRLLFTECLVEQNNTKNFDRGWEAGGDKLVLCRDAVLENSRFVRNRGTASGSTSAMKIVRCATVSSRTTKMRAFSTKSRSRCTHRTTSLWETVLPPPRARGERRQASASRAARIV